MLGSWRQMAATLHGFRSSGIYHCWRFHSFIDIVHSLLGSHQKKARWGSTSLNKKLKLQLKFLTVFPLQVYFVFMVLPSSFPICFPIIISSLYHLHLKWRPDFNINVSRKHFLNFPTGRSICRVYIPAFELHPCHVALALGRSPVFSELYFAHLQNAGIPTWYISKHWKLEVIFVKYLVYWSIWFRSL